MDVYQVGDKVMISLAPLPSLPPRDEWAWVIARGFTPDAPTTPMIVVRCQNTYDEDGRRRYLVLDSPADIAGHKPGAFVVGLDHSPA